jgi:hypothetical protein
LGRFPVEDQGGLASAFAFTVQGLWWCLVSEGIALAGVYTACHDNGLNQGDALRRWRRDYEYDSSWFSSPAIVAVGTVCVSSEGKIVADQAGKRERPIDDADADAGVDVWLILCTTDD